MVGQVKLAQLRELMRDAAAPKVVETRQTKERREFELYEFNTAPAYAVEQTPRARSIREVTRIATWYGWQAEMARALDAAGADSLHGLAHEDLEQLVTRMRLLEECVQHGGDAPDAPPAR